MKPNKRTMVTQRFTRKLAFLLLAALVLAACQGINKGQPQPVTIGLPALEQNALIYVAETRGYFQKNGIVVTINHFDSGVTALDALRQGEVDLAVAAEFPVVRALVEKDPIRVMASIDIFENDFIVARTDRGIQEISDLKGRRIGVTKHTINEFFLARFLELNGLSTGEVTQVDLKPAQFVTAIASGEVDALIAWNPYIQQIQQEVQPVVVWPAQSNQSVYGLLVSHQDWLAENPETAVRLLKALLEAEEYTLSTPEEAKEIVQERLDYQADYIDSIWDDHRFMITLDHSLIVAMNDEARWLLSYGLTKETQAPEFYNAFYLDGLEIVKPEAVSINR